MINPKALNGSHYQIKSLAHETREEILTIIIMLFSYFHHLQKSQLDVIMKTEPSFILKCSLLTREVFIMVLGRSQSEEFLIRRIELVNHMSSIISTNIFT